MSEPTISNVRELQLRVPPRTAVTPDMLEALCAKELHIDQTRIKRIDIVRRSIDARQRNVMVNLSVRVHVDAIDPSAGIECPVEYRAVPDDAPQAVVVGAGPAGLFAALQLIECGIRPIVLERGKDVDSRRLDLARINRTGQVDPDSNYCFGEGGAGAYSDGKLYTRSKKRGPVDKVLNILHQHGASRDILVDAHPHIGTDRLPGVIKAMRLTIERCGGQVYFNCTVEGFIIRDNRVCGVTTRDGRTFDGPVILATGHSARDVYELLMARNIRIEAKGIAVGVRLEHPQTLIDQIQYHSTEGRGKWLPAAEYSMLTRVDDRAVYSFCMCPGGFIIPAASAPDQLVVNGMSPSNRGTRWSNSGMVVEVLPEDIAGDDPLRVLRYQLDIEQKFYRDTQTHGCANPLDAPAQRMTDFVNRRESTSLPPTSYAPGIHPARIDRLLPGPISRRLAKAFTEFGRKSVLPIGTGNTVREKGGKKTGKVLSFLTDEAVLIGCETRTSSPVRIPRDNETLEHLTISGLYPCGEGAGYAGGIVSAAIDGLRSATAVAQKLSAPANPLPPAKP